MEQALLGDFCHVVQGEMRQSGHGHGWAHGKMCLFLELWTHRLKKATQGLSVVMGRDETAGLWAIVIFNSD